MVDLPDPGRQGMRALALCGWMFCTTSLVLFLVAISLPSWSVAKEGSTDGKLGLFSFCPDTWHFLNSTVLQELNRTKMQAGCVPVDRFCEVRLVRPGCSPELSIAGQLLCLTSTTLISRQKSIRYTVDYLCDFSFLILMPTQNFLPRRSKTCLDVSSLSTLLLRFPHLKDSHIHGANMTRESPVFARRPSRMFCFCFAACPSDNIGFPF